MPLRVWRGPANIAAEQAFLDHLLSPEGLSFRTARIVILRGDMPSAGPDSSLPLWSYTDKARLVLSCPGLTRKTAPLYLDEIARFRPDVLWIYPTGGDQLATLCLELGRTLPVRVVLSSSEGLSAECWPRLTAAFKGRVVDYYGQTERVCISVRHSPNEGWFVPAYGHVELMPEPFSPSLHGECQARVVATGYWNDRMPLVRYDTGDRIEYPGHYTSDDLAAVSVGLKPFIRVVGRVSEFLWAPGGARVQALNNIPREVTNIRQAQFVQHADYAIELRVIPLPGFGPEDEAALLRACRTKIPAAVPVKVCIVESLETTAQGKTPFVIRRAAEPESGIETAPRV
jgi:phenylacetate-CoA ligase